MFQSVCDPLAFGGDLFRKNYFKMRSVDLLPFDARRILAVAGKLSRKSQRVK
ncbi:MAG: hypothetical protein QME66_06695 [Candidatus Eisenbacteria bacterium]|nr:hypothetical protein [Candidatus Eisenbacteria bacterium]